MLIVLVCAFVGLTLGVTVLQYRTTSSQPADLQQPYPFLGAVVGIIVGIILGSVLHAVTREARQRGLEEGVLLMRDFHSNPQPSTLLLPPTPSERN